MTPVRPPGGVGGSGHGNPWSGRNRAPGSIALPSIPSRDGCVYKLLASDVGKRPNGQSRIRLLHRSENTSLRLVLSRDRDPHPSRSNVDRLQVPVGGESIHVSFIDPLKITTLLESSRKIPSLSWKIRPLDVRTCVSRRTAI